MSINSPRPCSIKSATDDYSSPRLFSSRGNYLARFGFLLLYSRPDHEERSMQPGTRHFALLLLVSLVAFSVSEPVAIGKKKESSAMPGQMDARKRAIHALNRLTFGPRPGDVERLMTMGVDSWIDEQLHPEKINDNVLESRLV